jgi:hypothetical protein
MLADVREPRVAGRFYTADPEALRRDVDDLLDRPSPAAARDDALAVIAPHAGYMYSGAVAGHTFARVAVPRSAIVLCPNHTGLGVPRSVWSRGAWRIPGATIPVADALADRVAREAHLDPDHAAHLREHAIEVQLPFLHRLEPAIAIVPVCLGHLSLAECRQIGEGLARAVAAEQERVLLVASTDMSHYVPADVARRLDMLAIERVLALDAEGLYEVVTQHDISMCGFIPTTVTLIAARALSTLRQDAPRALRAELVEYANSGDTSGDFERVVGYAGVVLTLASV